MRGVPYFKEGYAASLIDAVEHLSNDFSLDHLYILIKAWPLGYNELIRVDQENQN